MKKINLSFLLCCCMAVQALAQSSIQGIIKDNKGEGILLVTVALYNTEDSSIVAAESTTENGSFLISGVKDGTYYLSATMLGFTPYTVSSIVLPTDDLRTFDIVMEEDALTLQTVEVTARVPLIEQKSDRLIVNVENNLTSFNTTLLDVMKKIPGMVVINDRLNMAGQSNITILINGRSTKYMDVQSLLRDVPGDNVKQVEVIHQPGAEFDADGTGPVINIILKRNSLFGTNGSMNVVLGKDVDWTTASWLNLSHYQGSLNLRGSLVYINDATLDEFLITRRIKDDIYEQNSRDINRPNTYRGILSADWEASEKHRLGASIRYTENQTNIKGQNTTLVNFRENSTANQNILTSKEAKESFKLANVNAYYSMQFDTSTHKLDFDAHLVRMDNDDVSLFSIQEMNFGDFFPNRQYIQPGDIAINAFQVDYDYPFAGGLFELGVKYSIADLDNDLRALIEDDENDFKIDPIQSNRFVFEEEIKAAYAKLSFSRNSWSGTLGLRFEESNSIGTSVTADSSLTRDIAKLFPSLSIAKNITEDFGATFAYSYRIDRPSYQTLNPFIYSQDPFVSERGNPILGPSLTHSMKFNFTYDQEPFLNFEYKVTDDVIVSVTEQNDETRETALTAVNFDRQKLFNASFMIPLGILGDINGYTGVTATNLRYDSEYLGEQYNPSAWFLSFFLNVYYSLPWGIDTELSTWYRSGGLDGLMENEWMYSMSLGFSKEFMDDQFEVSLGVDDLFNRFYNGTIRYTNMDINIANRWYTPVINAKFTYNFGNRYLNGKRDRKGVASDQVDRLNK